MDYLQLFPCMTKFDLISGEIETTYKYEHYSADFHNTFEDIRSLHVRLTPLRQKLFILFAYLKPFFVCCFKNFIEPYLNTGSFEDLSETPIGVC